VGGGGATPTASSGELANAAVLRNKVVLGSVNANRRHWYKAAEALARADRSWLAGLVTRCERPEDFASALDRRPDDIKVAVRFAEL
jgi:threonine dehydrogenase-like Zn-dependent dehydrogenase